MPKLSTLPKQRSTPLTDLAVAKLSLAGMTLSVLSYAATAIFLRSSVTHAQATLPRTMEAHIGIWAAILLFLLFVGFFVLIMKHLSKQSKAMIVVWAIWAAVSSGQYFLAVPTFETSVVTGLMAEAIVVALFLSVIKSHRV